MFLIFGLRTKARRLGWAPSACRVCGHTGTLMVVRESTKLSLFFVPLVPIRTKHAVQCANPVCGDRFTVSAGEARRMLAAGVGSSR